MRSAPQTPSAVRTDLTGLWRGQGGEGGGGPAVSAAAAAARACMCDALLTCMSSPPLLSSLGRLPPSPPQPSSGPSAGRPCWPGHGRGRRLALRGPSERRRRRRRRRHERAHTTHPPAPAPPPPLSRYRRKATPITAKINNDPTILRVKKD